VARQALLRKELISKRCNIVINCDATSKTWIFIVELLPQMGDLGQPRGGDRHIKMLEAVKFRHRKTRALRVENSGARRRIAVTNETIGHSGVAGR
jgi:hypothetical protein